MTRLQRLGYWGPVILVGGAITVISNLSGSAIPFGFWVARVSTPLHFLEFAVLAFFLARAINRGRMPLQWRTLWTVVLICFAYAILDELHQLFIPGRSCTALDVLADTLGSGVAAALWKVLAARWPFVR